MTLTRWKLLAGVFGIAIVGLVAMANPQCPGKNESKRETAPPSRDVTKPATTSATAPMTAPVVASTPLAVELPKVSNSPKTPTVEPSNLTPIDPVAIPELRVNPTNTAPVLGSPEIAPIPLPVARIEPTKPAIQVGVPELPSAETPLIPNPKTPELSPPAISSPKLPTVAPHASELPSVESKRNTVPTAPTIPSTIPIAVSPERGKPQLFDATETPRESAAMKDTVKEEVETRVRVVVPLGKSPAKFEVLAGDVVLLQAVCEQVEVRSPGAKPATNTPIKASGKVRFSAPGCEGTCDSLCVLPSSGEVELSGAVRVLCKYGKAETEIQATAMKFKLGTIPNSIVPVQGMQVK